MHRTRERDDVLWRRKAKALREDGTLNCEACMFNFVIRYGKHGRGFIESHHTKPISALGWRENEAGRTGPSLRELSPYGPYAQALDDGSRIEKSFC